MPLIHTRQVFGVLFAAMVCVVFNVSFAAIVYSGDLAPYLQRGIGLTLAGSIVLGTMGALALSYKGSIVQAQDAPAILLSGSVAAIVSQGQVTGEALFATVAALVFVTSLACGLSFLAIGKWKLALLARYIPYPVLAGFLAATGVLLFKGGIELAIGYSLDMNTLADFWSPAAAIKWVPVVGASLCLMFATQFFRSSMTLPVALIATTLGFLALTFALGLGVEDAQTQGFLLGPFPDASMLDGVNPMVLVNADWTSVFSQVPVIFAVVAICLIGMTLNASGLELELGKDFDFNRELQGVGLANSVGAFFGGLSGYHHIGQTLLANKLGLTSSIAGGAGAVGGVAVLLFGTKVLSFLPVGLFATVITYLGMDLIRTWFWGNRHKLNVYDYGIVAIIPISALVFSFLTAIGVGLAMALCIFVVSYARHSTIRLKGDLSTRRSFVERAQDQIETLSSMGHKAQFIELTGYLFFGSANALRDKLLVLLDNEPNCPNWLVVDFKHVVGMDISTTQMLLRLQGDCDQRGIHFVLSGINASVKRTLQPVLDRTDTPQFSSLDGALEYVEDRLLAYGTELHQTISILDQIHDLQTDEEMARFSKMIELQNGETLIAVGTKSTEIYVLVSGQLLVSVPGLGGTSKIVAKIRPGALVGEMNYYLQGERTADVIAEGSVQVACIDVQCLEASQDESSKVASVFHKAMARHLSERLKRTTTLLRNLES